MSVDTTLSELNVIATDVMILRYTTIATLCLMVYDYLDTIEEEIHLVWTSRLSFAKIVFFWNRYLPFLTTIIGTYVFITDSNHTNCKPAFLAVGAFCSTQYVLAEGILFMRTYAVWERKRHILWLLSIIYAAESFGAYYTTAVFISSATPSTEIHLFHAGCLLTFPNRIDWVSLLILIFSETLCISLLLAKGVFHYRHSGSTLIRTLYKDGVTYYVTVLATSVANLIVLHTASSFLCSFLFITQGVIHSILCNRLLLHIRGAYASLSVDTIHRDFTRKLQTPGVLFPLTDLSSNSAGISYITSASIHV